MPCRTNHKFSGEVLIGMSALGAKRRRMDPSPAPRTEYVSRLALPSPPPPSESPCDGGGGVN
eukprot:15438888-Alexandrium_andersonii.AAC.1